MIVTIPRKRNGEIPVTRSPNGEIARWPGVSAFLGIILNKKILSVIWAPFLNSVQDTGPRENEALFL